MNIHSLSTDLFAYIMQGLPSSLKYGFRCERCGSAISSNSTEYLASEDFRFPASLNSPNIFRLARLTIYHLLSEFNEADKQLLEYTVKHRKKYR